MFQIERLYRFNAKFFPRWEPRYVVYERRLGFPRVGLAALWAEGQLPKPWRRDSATSSPTSSAIQKQSTASGSSASRAIGERPTQKSSPGVAR